MSTPPPRRPLPPKKDLALALLQESSVFIHLDPRKPEVIVPLYFKKQPQLVLQVGLNMAVNIPDLAVDDEGVSCTLSFNRTPFWCRLPWSAVYALVGEDHQGMIWPDEVPPEVSAAQREKAPEAEAKGPRARGARGKPRRKVEAVPAKAETKTEPGMPVPESGSGGGGASLPAARSLGPLPVSVGPSPAARSVGASPPSKGTREPGKPGKRELPPYLRVVK